MSGDLGRAAAPIVARERRYMEDLPKFDAPKNSSVEQTCAAYESYLEACEVKLREIMSVTESLEKYNDKWIDLTASLKDEERKAEEKLRYNGSRQIRITSKPSKEGRQLSYIYNVDFTMRRNPQENYLMNRRT